MCVAALALASVVPIKASDSGVTLIGMGRVAGTDLDKSGFAGQQICQSEDPANCTDQATLGGFGSALAYTGFNDVFLAVPDRGPFDGRTDVPYLDRFHFMQLTVDRGAAFPNIRTVLLDTRPMKAPGNRNLLGSSADFGNRFDPEGVAIGPNGTFFVSDEYGPSINEFNRQGHLVRRIARPAKCSNPGYRRHRVVR